MKNTHHFAKSQEFLDAAVLLRTNYLALGGISKVGYLAGYCVLIHLCLEHLLKSIFSEEEVQELLKKGKGHNLNRLYTQAVQNDRVEQSEVRDDLIKEVAPYGYPVTGSERYPEPGHKTLFLEERFIVAIQEMSSDIRSRLVEDKGIYRIINIKQ